MFGKEFASHIDILTQSFEEMSDRYQKGSRKKNLLIEKAKELYIKIFGIPEIGFQLRSLYFKKIIFLHLLNKNLERILDAGSGIGAYAFWLAKLFPNAKVIGGDINKKKLKISESLKRELSIQNTSFIYFDIMYSSTGKPYDLITTIDVLEHVDNFEKALINLYSLLNKKGYLYIHVPQPNQKRIFKRFQHWHHNDHIREGISKNVIENCLRKIGLEIIESKQAFGFFGKLAWELNHMMLSKSFILTGITFPFLFILSLLDLLFKNRDGLGIAILSQKK